MKASMAADVDAYIAEQPVSVQELLNKIRDTIRNAAPDAEELISYQMPAYKLAGPLVYFGASKNHIGFYPTNSGVTNFQKELSAYKTSKGAIQFPIDKPLPVKLIKDIVQFRVKENEMRAQVKSRTRTAKKK